MSRYSNAASNKKNTKLDRARYALGVIGAMNYLIKSGQLPSGKNDILSPKALFRKKPVRPGLTAGRRRNRLLRESSPGTPKFIRQIYSKSAYQSV